MCAIEEVGRPITIIYPKGGVATLSSLEGYLHRRPEVQPIKGILRLLFVRDVFLP
jgi:hypothetical protein